LIKISGRTTQNPITIKYSIDVAYIYLLYIAEQQTTTTDSMINIDKNFARNENYDYSTTSEGISTEVASINTRTIVEGTHIPSSMPTIHILEPFRIDAKPFINRPYFVEEVIWTNTAALHTCLNTQYYKLPRDLILSNRTLLEGLKIGSLYRSSCELNISVAGTITHAGCVIVGLLPPLDQDLSFLPKRSTLINTILSGPHGFLHANEATSLTLKVPWYCNTDLDSLDFTLPSDAYKNPVNLNAYSGNMATLVFFVLNPLQPSVGSSQSLSIIVEASFKNLDILVPTPRFITYSAQSYFTNLGTGMLDGASRYAKTLAGDGIDAVRSWIRSFTGLHNPNTPQLNGATVYVKRNRLNNIDTTTFMENLDPYANDSRIVQEPIFHTLEDEMSFNHIIGKRQYLGTFRVSQTDTVGVRLFNRPISPYQGGTAASVGGFPETFSNNIELLHTLSRAWKGPIDITIQSVMNNKQQVKLRLLQLYNPSVSITTSYPEYRSLLQAPSHLIEYTAGGQERTIRLPYLSRNRLTPCARDNSTEALIHGEYYIFVAQPLANSTNSPADIFFNVYMTLNEDFNFYGYSTEAFAAGPPIYQFLPFEGGVSDPSTEIREPEQKLIFEPQMLKVMNEPQPQKQENNTISPATDTRLQPIIDIRPLIRRLYPSQYTKFSLTAGTPLQLSVDLRNIIGEGTRSDTEFQNPCSAISRMYYGKHAGFKIRASFDLEGDITADLAVKAYFLPQQIVASNINVRSNVLMGGTPNSLSIQFNNTNALQFPLNNSFIPIEVQDKTIFEFTVPNCSTLKFIGGPTKMVRGNHPHPFDAAGDAGNLLFNITYPRDIKGGMLLETACTDESRFGFHTLAPVVDKSQGSGVINTLNFGSLADPLKLPSVYNNPFVYYTRN
jgi:hypothetical protein